MVLRRTSYLGGLPKNMKHLLVLCVLSLFSIAAICQPFKSKATVTVKQEWRGKPGKKGHYEWTVSDASGKVLKTYDDYLVFEQFNGNIFLVGCGEPESKYSLRKAKNYGLIDLATGKEIYPCKAYVVEKVSECLVYILENGKHYLMRPNGEFLTNSPYEYANFSRNGKAWLNSFPVKSGGKYGYMDSCGTLKMPFRYDEATSFSNGASKVRLGNKFTFIDSNLNELGPPRFTDLYDLYNGLASYSTTGVREFGAGVNGGKVGLINKKGEILTPEIYEDIQWQNQVLTGKLNGQWVKIDPEAPALTSASATAVAPVLDREFHKQARFGYYKYGFKLGGKWLVKPTYDIAYPFQGNFALVGREGRDKITTLGGNEANAMEYGLINIKGEEVVPTRYKALWLYDRGLYGFAVGKGNYYQWKMGIMDSTGKVVVQPEFNVLAELREGLIAARKDKVAGYIDLNGKIVLPFKYAIATSFVNGYAAVADSENNWYWIDKSGKELMNGRRFTSVSDWDSTGKAWAWHTIDRWSRPDSALLLTKTGNVVGSRPLNGPPPIVKQGRARCSRCNGSGQAYKSREVNSSFTWTEGMFQPVETRTTYTSSYKVYEKDGACPKCRGTGYEQ